MTRSSSAIRWQTSLPPRRRTLVRLKERRSVRSPFCQARASAKYAAICRGGDELAGAIDAALITLGKSGSISAISLRWLGKDRCTLSADAPAEAEFALQRRIFQHIFICHRMYIFFVCLGVAEQKVYFAVKVYIAVMDPLQHSGTRYINILS